MIELLYIRRLSPRGWVSAVYERKRRPEAQLLN
jgi:hypothetical protein